MAFSVVHYPITGERLDSELFEAGQEAARVVEAVVGDITGPWQQRVSQPALSLAPPDPRVVSLEHLLIPEADDDITVGYTTKQLVPNFQHTYVQGLGSPIRYYSEGESEIAATSFPELGAAVVSNHHDPRSKAVKLLGIHEIAHVCGAGHCVDLQCYMHPDADTVPAIGENILPPATLADRRRPEPEYFCEDSTHQLRAGVRSLMQLTAERKKYLRSYDL